MPSFLRRILNPILGTGLFILTLPLMATIAILVWLDDGRPVLFAQLRAGKDNHPFKIVKFRTLAIEAEGTTSPSKHTTRIGSFLRQWALDELPQLWNVIRGDMNLVGPRPVLLAEAHGYDDQARERLAVRPGLTGWAQVHGRNSLDWRERLELDLWYVRNRSFCLDFYILLKTPFVLLSGKGVYGPGTNDPSASDVQSQLQR